MAHSLTFAPMTLDDVAAVDDIEQVSFASPWSVKTYQHELKHNPRSFYWVASTNDEALPPILAYGGYWLMGEEAHVVTIATHPAYRQHGLGNWLLLHMLERMRQAGIHEVTLEVRRSNFAAQALYRKLGFEEVGMRKRYYRDNDEDALLLTLFRLHEDSIWNPLAQRMANTKPSLSVHS